MNRNLTNLVRFVMDECLPAIVRDNKYFMYPFYYIAYRGRNIPQVMDLKREIHRFTERDYRDFYNSLNSISRNRVTDLNRACVDFILDHLDSAATTLLDVGCGNGFLLGEVRKRYPALELYGADVKTPPASAAYHYIKATVDDLPFPDKAFDIVTCCHTLEHLLHLDRAVAELKRLARKQLIVVVPRQRYFYYTLDEHVQFFPYRERLTSVIGIKDHLCEDLRGDWMYVGSLATSSPHSGRRP